VPCNANAGGPADQTSSQSEVPLAPLVIFDRLSHLP